MRFSLWFSGRAQWLAWCTLGALVSCQCPGAPPPQSLKPLNVVVVTVDTLRPDHLGCYGYRGIETPTLDRIAQSGVLFENGVIQSPLTPPSHANIFTGLNPPSHKVRDTGGCILSRATPTLASLLAQRGWNTAAFVSSAVLKKRFGFDWGFAVYDDQMPRSGNGQEFLEDAERRAGDTSTGPYTGWTSKAASPSSCGCTSTIRIHPTTRRFRSASGTRTARTMARSPTPTGNWGV